MKRSFKTAIAFSVFALISLWLSITAPAGTTLFSFNAGKELFAIPDFQIPVANASWIITAVTAESTPPDKPQITRSRPTCFLILCTISDLKWAIDQSPLQPQMSRAKLRRSLAPSGVCTTSMWNCVA